MRLALIGIGHQGKHYLRFLRSVPGIDPTLLVDLVAEKASDAAAELSVVSALTYSDHLSEFDAAIIAVPTSDHFQIASELIQAGKHVLIEKPVTATISEAEQLAALAEKQGVIAQVGFPERFNPVVRKARLDITRPLFIESHRLGVFSPRSLDIDVVLDLMIHDLDLLYLFLKEEPQHVEAVGIPILSTQIDIANARIKFAGQCVVNLTASRVSDKRMRKMRLFQPYSYLSLDLAEQTYSQFSLQPNLCNAGFPEINKQKYQPVEETHPLLEQLISFRDAIDGKESEGVSVNEAIPSLRMALAVKRTFPEVKL
jgi:predicted dehydrogenase